MLPWQTRSITFETDPTIRYRVDAFTANTLRYTDLDDWPFELERLSEISSRAV